MAKFDSYVICTSPRSGSTLLCNLLAKARVAGVPESYFHHPSVSKWLSHFKLAPEETTPEGDVLGAIFTAAIAEGSLDTGVFGLRLQRHSFDFFIQKLAVFSPDQRGDAERFHEAFGRTSFIYLSRRDKVEQAVSYVKAEQTGLWHIAPDGTELERQSPARVLVYDGPAISARVEEITAFDNQWESWFAKESIDPFRVTYEALSADPIDCLSRLLDHLGLACDAVRDITPGVAKLADTTSQDWVKRFRYEM